MWTKEPDLTKDGYELKDIYSDKDQFEVNMPDEIQRRMNRKRKQQAVLTGVAFERAAELCKEMAQSYENLGMEQSRINYWNIKGVKMQQNMKKIGECGNFGAFAEIEMKMPNNTKKEFIRKTNGNSCNRYWLCPRCQMVQQQQHGNLVYEIMQEMPEDERYYFITLTAPNQWIYSADLQEEEENLKKAIRLLQSAFTKMTDCCPFKQKKNGKNVYLFDGFIVMLEIPPKDSRLGGWNPHLHVVGAVSGDKSITAYDFVRLWTNAYNTVAGTNYNYLMMQIQEIREWKKEELKKMEETKYITESKEQNETQELKQISVMKVERDFEAKIGDLTQDIKIQIAKIVKYSMKPNDRILFTARLHQKNHGCGDYDNYDNDFWQTAKEYEEETHGTYDGLPAKDVFFAEDFEKWEIERTARNLIPYSGATFGVHKITYKGIFRTIKRRIEERKQKDKEHERQLPQETKDRYLVNWQPWKGGFYAGRWYAQASKKQQEKMFESPRKRKQADENTLKKEMPEEVKQRIIKTLFGDEVEGQMQFAIFAEPEKEYNKTIQKLYDEMFVNYMNQNQPCLPDETTSEQLVKPAESSAKATTASMPSALSGTVTEPVTACNDVLKRPAKLEIVKPPPKQKEQFENRIKRGSVKDLLF